MIVYRLAGKKHAGDISGTGAAIFGGRWNRKGSPVLYTGESKEIALLEYLVHLPAMIVPDLEMVTIQIPDTFTEFPLSSLPGNWKDYPAPAVLAGMAENWISNEKGIALKVPSSIIHTSSNYILNCKHPGYPKKVKILKREKFSFDARLMKL